MMTLNCRYRRRQHTFMSEKFPQLHYVSSPLNTLSWNLQPMIRIQTTDWEGPGVCQRQAEAYLLIFALMRIVYLVCNGIHTSLTPRIRYNLHHFSKILVGLYISLIFLNPLVDLFLF